MLNTLAEVRIMAYDHLKLDNQLCFPIYAASRLIIREYQPFLDRLEITYPQYLVLLVLWETDHLTVNEIAKRLILNTNTITPLLKRMESQGIIIRKRSETDERKVMITLTPKGAAMKTEAATIPAQLAEAIDTTQFSMEQLKALQSNLFTLIRMLNRDKSDPLYCE